MMSRFHRLSALLLALVTAPVGYGAESQPPAVPAPKATADATAKQLPDQETKLGSRYWNQPTPHSLPASGIKEDPRKKSTRPSG